MRAIQNQVKKAKGRPLPPKPDRLWLHYCSALVIVLCLILATYLLNRTMVERGVVAASGIIKSNEEVMAAQEIVAMSDALLVAQSPDFTSFDKAVHRFEAAYFDMLATDSRSDVLTEHFFGDAAGLHKRVREFLALTKQFSSAAPAERITLNERIHQIYGAGGMKTELLRTAALIAQQIKTEAAFFTTLQLTMLAASALVLLAEAVFIFLPAQRSVQSSLRAMRQTTSDLRASQTQLKEMNSQLEHIVGHDQLTGLPNRRSLTEFLTTAISAKSGEDWSLFLVGLDDFKSVNDTIGHDYGDELLIAVSRALTSCVDYEHLVAHVGGDEFALISSEPTRYLVERIAASFREPFIINGRRTPMNASIGHLSVGDGTKLPLDILADAEIALKHAKNVGGNRAQAFTQDLRDDQHIMQ